MLFLIIHVTDIQSPVIWLVELTSCDIYNYNQMTSICMSVIQNKYWVASIRGMGGTLSLGKIWTESISIGSTSWNGFSPDFTLRQYSSHTTLNHICIINYSSRVWVKNHIQNWGRITYWITIWGEQSMTKSSSTLITTKHWSLWTKLVGNLSNVRFLAGT